MQACCSHCFDSSCSLLRLPLSSCVSPLSALLCPSCYFFTVSSVDPDQFLVALERELVQEGVADQLTHLNVFVTQVMPSSCSYPRVSLFADPEEPNATVSDELDPDRAASAEALAALIPTLPAEMQAPFSEGISWVALEGSALLLSSFPSLLSLCVFSFLSYPMCRLFDWADS